MSHYHLPIADMMSGLMMVFLFIAVVFMVDVNQAKEKVEVQLQQTAADRNELQRLNAVIREQQARIAAIAGQVETVRERIHRRLRATFGRDLAGWDAEIVDQTTVRFRSPDVLFESRSAVVRERYRRLLADFFPRYVAALEPFRAEIEALRIEGHSSSAWRGARDAGEAFLNNMRLSEERALNTLAVCFGRVAAKADELGGAWPRRRDWLQQVLTANGRSSARLLRGADGNEDAQRSRRVEFKVVVKTEQRLREIRAAAAQEAG